MKKIPSVFQRDWASDSKLILPVVTPGCEWVSAGEGAATVKWDGTACLWQKGQLWKRYDCKPGKTAPAGWVPAQDADATTGHWPGWVPVGDEPESRWHREAAELGVDVYGANLAEGATYELIGEKINGNPHRAPGHRLVPHWHESHVLEDCPRDFDGLREFLTKMYPASWRSNVLVALARTFEGIVFWRNGEPGAKVKRRDFGLPWPEWQK